MILLGRRTREGLGGESPRVENDPKEVMNFGGTDKPGRRAAGDLARKPRLRPIDIDHVFLARLMPKTFHTKLLGEARMRRSGSNVGS
jgi:hypothetical protein